MWSVRELEGDWEGVPQGSVCVGTKGDQSCTGLTGLADFTMLQPLFAWRGLKLMTCLFLEFSNFFLGRSKPWITRTTVTETMDLGVPSYLQLMNSLAWAQWCSLVASQCCETQWQNKFLGTVSYPQLYLRYSHCNCLLVSVPPMSAESPSLALSSLMRRFTRGLSCSAS